MRERLATLAMGARFELVLEGRDLAHARAAGEAALEELERCDARWSLFRSDSLIARANREAGLREVQLDHETFELLAACSALREQTLGAFDVALGARMAQLGHRGERAHSLGERRGAFELNEARRTVRFTREGTQLDLGAIGKGEALDRAAEILRESGITCALLHGGTSSVLALGAPAGCAGWRVGLEGFEPARSVELRDQSLSVSAPHGRTARRGGAEVGHLVDPLDGAPLPLGSRSAALAPTGREAEAWSTAAAVLFARGLDARDIAPATVQLHASAAAPHPSPRQPTATLR